MTVSIAMAIGPIAEWSAHEGLRQIPGTYLCGTRRVSFVYSLLLLLPPLSSSCTLLEKVVHEMGGGEDLADSLRCQMPVARTEKASKSAKADKDASTEAKGWAIESSASSELADAFA